MGPQTRSRTLGAVTAGMAVFMLSCTRTTPPAPPSSIASPKPPPTPRSSATTGVAVPGSIDSATLTGRIVFSDGTNDIWVVNADGSDLRRLTTNSANDFDPQLSPDGSLIAFRSERDGNNEVYVMNSDGSDQHDVSRDAADDWGPTWSPGGRVLWNCARGVVTGFRPCLSNADGSAVRILPIHRYVEYMAWSPDGTKIAFMSQEPGAFGSDPDYNIYVVNADGSRLRRLTDSPADDGFPSWSPDGSQIAFSTTRDDCSHSDAASCKTTGDIGPYHTLYLMNADGSDQHRVTDQFAQFVDWSPDGTYLVFSPGLNVIRLDGTGLITLHGAGAGEPEFADWHV